ncbi:MAG TPA: multidrug efflux RND transporter permease subunit [Chthoniobacterales bacterium]|nr:multidrug efflux RND transporter permease subunit [Chthoniobacterales bacterium]
MKFSHFFIERPIFAMVISIVIVIAGLLAYISLPTAQYPEIAPPTVQVTASYPGADPKVVAETVATPIEEQVNGVENMLYMSSQSTADGTMTLTVTFKLGTDLDIAQVLVQNRVAIATPQLPLEVRNLGVTVQKQSPDLMMVVHLISPNGTYDQAYISNYAFLQIRDPLSRLDGIGNVNVFGAREYSMRIWLDPNRMYSRGLTTDDIIAAILAQNVQVAAGRLGAEPAPPGTELQLTINTEGRLVTPDQFGEIIVKRGDNGEIVYLSDVSSVELGAKDYNVSSYLDGKPAVALAIFQLPGSNAVKTAHEVRALMAVLSRSFPVDLKYAIVYDPTQFIEQSVEAVIHTLFEAVALVLIVVLVFLQTWRATIIPLLAVPVSLIGTFAVMACFGFSLNNLSLFGLVLAIGIVVDDAIVVVEAVEHNIELGMQPKEATQKAMDQVGGAVVAIAVVLSAVFIPTAFITGITGQFYRQFALTIAVSTVISAFNSLTLSPALAGLLLKPRDAKLDPLTRLLDFLLGWFFRLFNKGFEASVKGYIWAVRRLLRFAAIALLVYVGFLVLTFFGFKAVPSGFIPTQDQGYLIVFAQLPDGASLQRAEEVRKQISELARQVPGVAHTVEFAGFSALDGTNRNNAVTTFLPLTPFEERVKDPRLNGVAITAAVRQKFAGIQDARVLVFPPPPVRGIGNAGGFKLQIQDRRGAGLPALQAATDQLISKARSGHGLVGLFTSFRSQVPQIYLDIDRRKVETLDVPINSVFSTLQAYLGSTYVNDFNFVNRTNQVNIQAGARYRIEPESIGQLYTRNNKNQMVPLATLMDVQETVGPDKVMHYNIYPSAEINGSTLPGVSSGQAIEVMQTLADQTLPSQFGYEWTELSLQEILAGNSALYIFPLCALFVFLVLAAQYESWSLPLSIILIVPMCLFAAITGVYIRGSDNNIFTQIGFVVLIGLACKNAILIVEYAKQQMDAGLSRHDAAIEASKLRLRPILMTSFAFTLGVYPLVNAAGPGAEMRQAIGTAVFSGMIGVTLFGIFLTPVFFSVIMKLFEGKKERSARSGGAPADRPVGQH